MKEKREIEDLKPACLPAFPCSSSRMGSQRMSAEVGSCDKAVSGRKEFGGGNLCDPLEMGPRENLGYNRWSDTELVIRSETRRLNLEGWKER